jgi:hypothetical protein
LDLFAMQRPRARPTFTMQLPITPEAVCERVTAQLAACGGKVTGSVLRRTISLTVCEANTHFWSPHLDVQLEGVGEGTRVYAVFAPHPQIWTAFIALQLLFGLLSVGAGVWVTSMLMLHRDLGLALAALAAMLFGGGFSYGAAYVGQGIGSEQMYELRAFLDAALRGAITSSAST